MPEIAVSVITAAYNLIANRRADSFRQMVASVRELGRLLPVEHLVKDGASTDGSLELYREVCPDSRVISAPDDGIFDAMNRAAAEAAGTYLVFLNSDDFYHDPAALAELVRRLDRSGADYAYAPIRRVRRDGSIREVN